MLDISRKLSPKKGRHLLGLSVILPSLLSTHLDINFSTGISACSACCCGFWRFESVSLQVLDSFIHISLLTSGTNIPLQLPGTSCLFIVSSIFSLLVIFPLPFSIDLRPWGVDYPLVYLQPRIVSHSRANILHFSHLQQRVHPFLYLVPH